MINKEQENLITEKVIDSYEKVINLSTELLDHMDIKKGDNHRKEALRILHEIETIIKNIEPFCNEKYNGN